MDDHTDLFDVLCERMADAECPPTDCATVRNLLGGPEDVRPEPGSGDVLRWLGQLGF